MLLEQIILMLKFAITLSYMKQIQNFHGLGSIVEISEFYASEIAPEVLP
jgi:hypothetical protein